MVASTNNEGTNGSQGAVAAAPAAPTAGWEVKRTGPRTSGRNTPPPTGPATGPVGQQPAGGATPGSPSGSQAAVTSFTRPQQGGWGTGQLTAQTPPVTGNDHGGRVATVPPSATAALAATADKPGSKESKKDKRSRSRKVLIGLAAVLAGLLPIAIIVTTMLSASDKPDTAIEVNEADFTLEGAQEGSADSSDDFSAYMPNPKTGTQQPPSTYKSRSGRSSSSKSKSSSSSKGSFSTGLPPAAFPELPLPDSVDDFVDEVIPSIPAPVPAAGTYQYGGAWNLRYNGGSCQIPNWCNNGSGATMTAGANGALNFAGAGATLTMELDGTPLGGTVLNANTFSAHHVNISCALTPLVTGSAGTGTAGPCVDPLAVITGNEMVGTVTYSVAGDIYSAHISRAGGNVSMTETYKLRASDGALVAYDISFAGHGISYTANFSL